MVLFLVFGLLQIGSAEPRNPVPEELQYLEEPDRGEWQMPERVIETLRLRESDVVADIGAGTGYFSRRFARQVAHVYAEDVDPEALSFLRREALAKVTVVPGKPENPMLPPNSCNIVYQDYSVSVVHRTQKVVATCSCREASFCPFPFRERTPYCQRALFKADTMRMTAIIASKISSGRSVFL